MNSVETSSLFISCQVCQQESNCKQHYGAVVCRACAAFFSFFRRSVSFKTTKRCKKKQKCNSSNLKKFLKCKYCRLQKCKAVGMTYEKFQFERDSFVSQSKLQETIPTTIDIFCGRSNLIIFRVPEYSSTSPELSKNTIDLRFLVDQVETIFVQGPVSPLQSRSRLEKLALGLNPLLGSRSSCDLASAQYGRDECMINLENEVLAVTKWLTYFDDFQKLSVEMKIKMLQGIWSIWWKLGRAATIARDVQSKFNQAELRHLGRDHLFYSYDQSNIDMSWLSKYTVEELKFFLDIPTEYRLDTLTREIISLNPSDMELSFMLGQLCFHYVGKRYQGEILQVSDKFQEILANDLHDYYVNQMKQPYYIKRLATMMKINNLIQQEVMKNRTKTELARVFNIFCVKISHPDLFI